MTADNSAESPIVLTRHEVEEAIKSRFSGRASASGKSGQRFSELLIQILRETSCKGREWVGPDQLATILRPQEGAINRYIRDFRTLGQVRISFGDRGVRHVVVSIDSQPGAAERKIRNPEKNQKDWVIGYRLLFSPDIEIEDDFSGRTIFDAIDNFSPEVKNFLRSYVGTAKRPAPFGGGQDNLSLFAKWLHDDQAMPFGLLCGTPGSGKSTLMAHFLLHQACQEDNQFHLALCPVSARFGTSAEHHFLQLLQKSLASIYHRGLSGRPDPGAIRSWILEMLQRPPPDGRAVLLIIDGIDEAAGWEVGPDLLPVEQLPHLRIIATSRWVAGDHELDRLVSRLGWENKGNLFTLEGLNAQHISECLNRSAKGAIKPDERIRIADELFALTEGDPLLVGLYVQDVVTSLHRGDDVGSITFSNAPRGLHGVFARWLDEQVIIWQSRRPLRESRARTLLKLFAVSAGPICSGDIALAFPNEFPDKYSVTETVSDLRRFLIGDSVEIGYVLAHARLKDFFSVFLMEASERLTLTQTLCDIGTNLVGNGSHQDIIAGAYFVRHYLAHLRALNAPIEPFLEVLEERWLRAFEHADGHAVGYQGAVKDVLDYALDKGEPQFAAQLRAILFQSSGSSSYRGVSSRTLIEALRSELLDWSSALELFQTRDVKDYVSFLIDAGGILESSQKSRLIGEAWSVAQRFPESDLRWSSFMTVLSRLLPELTGSDQASCIDMMLTYEPFSISTGHECEAILSAVPFADEVRSKQLIAKAKETAGCAYDGRPKALCNLIIAKNGNPDKRDEFLAAALDELPRITDPRWRASVMAEASDQLAEPAKTRTLDEAWLRCMRAPDSLSKIEVLAQVARRHPKANDLLSDCIKVCHRLDDSGDRATSLAIIARHLPLAEAEIILREALQEYLSNKDNQSELAFFEHALSRRDLTDRSLYLQELNRVVRHQFKATAYCDGVFSILPHLPSQQRIEQVQSLLDAERCIGDELELCRAVAAISMELPDARSDDFLRQGYGFAGRVVDPYDQVMCCCEIFSQTSASNIERNVSRVLDVASQIRRPSDKARALGAIANVAPKGVVFDHLTEILESYLATDCPFAKAQIVNALESKDALADQDPDKFPLDLSNTKPTDLNQHLVLGRLLSPLHCRSAFDKFVAQLLKLSDQISVPWEKCRLLSSVSNELDGRQRRRVVQRLERTVKNQNDPINRARCLLSIASNYDDEERKPILDKICDVLDLLDSSVHKFEIILQLGNLLPQRDKSTIYSDLITKIKHKSYALGENLSDVIENVDEEKLVLCCMPAGLFSGDYMGHRGVQALVNRWQDFCDSAKRTSWQACLLVLELASEQGRKGTLNSITALAPVIAEVGGEHVIQQVGQSVSDAGTWWR